MLKKDILKVISYFAFFSYAPSFEQIYTFLPVKSTKTQLKKILNRMVEEGSLIHKEAKPKAEEELAVQFLTFNFSPLTSALYTLPPHRIFFKKRVDRAILSEKKANKVSHYLKILSSFPQIKLVGLSGAVAVEGTSKTDDVDLFIIAGQGRLWTARFLALFLAELLGIRRRRKAKKVKDRVCLNLFFAADDLSVPASKRNVYVGHEILQMKPLVNKDGIYDRFLAANSWVSHLFPNAKMPSSKFKIQNSRLSSPTTQARRGQAKLQFKIQSYLKNSKLLIVILNLALLTFNLIADTIEQLLKAFQLLIIERHKTTEIVSDTQLWFHPVDFEDILKKKGLLT